MADLGTLPHIPKHRFREPVRNLPSQTTARTGESDFTLAFARAYFQNFQSLHGRSRKDTMACAREIPVNGYGIADLVCVQWEQARLDEGDVAVGVDEFCRSTTPTVRAFEAKLKAWREAMLQAHRYRYYANSAIVILPVKVCANALPYLDTFKSIRVGLWGFDRESGRIATYHTPSPTKPLAPKHTGEVVNKVFQATKTLPVL